MMSQVYRDSGQGGEVICPLDRTARRTTERRGAGEEQKDKLLTGKIVDGVIKKAK